MEQNPKTPKRNATEVSIPNKIETIAIDFYLSSY